MNAPTSERTRIEPRHRSGDTAFVQENKVFWRDCTDAFDKCGASFQVLFAVPLGGMERLFLRRKPNLRTRYQTRPRLSKTQASLFSFSWKSGRSNSCIATKFRIPRKSLVLSCYQL